MKLTIHELPRRVWDAWETAIAHTPIEITADHHALGLHRDHPVGSIVLENQRYVPNAVNDAASVIFVRGHAFRRGDR